MHASRAAESLRKGICPDNFFFPLIITLFTAQLIAPLLYYTEIIGDTLFYFRARSGSFSVKDHVSSSSESIFFFLNNFKHITNK